MAATHTISHPTLQSKLTGVVLHDGKIVQYRGVKFANIPARFARSTPIESYPLELDCTKFGPIAPQDVNPAFEAWLFAIPPEQSVAQNFTMDEYECLNLIVNTPVNVKEGELLPVFVNIHGGANLVGTASADVVDISTLTLRGLDTGKPIITVSMNYRLAIWGFGVLSDGTGANNGLFDQRVALQWVKKHIRGFGGDPDRITVGGESAGAFAVDSHLQAKGSETDPSLQLFRRGVLMSGAVMSNKPLLPSTVSKITAMYGNALEGKGTADEKLKKATVEELMAVQAKLGPRLWPYVDDGSFYEKPYKPYKIVPSWCEGLLIGDCEFEAFLWKLQFEGSPPGVLVSAFESLGETGRKLIEAYDIAGDNVTKGTLEFINDGLFIYPNERTIEAWKAHPGKHVHRYLLDQRNPWNVTNGAHHGVDLIYLYGRYKYKDAGAQKVGMQMQDDFINFFTSPKEDLDKNLGWKSYVEARAYGGPDGNVSVAGTEEIAKRRRIEISMGTLKELGDMKVAKAIGLRRPRVMQYYASGKGDLDEDRIAQLSILVTGGDEVFSVSPSDTPAKLH
ncbi:Alpha/Beta hydrolase protein [Kalaharituber pfeilii]|nr:Alpha/Beta hydrolase protein [Kalaharituber pfeilii]